MDIDIQAIVDLATYMITFSFPFAVILNLAVAIANFFMSFVRGDKEVKL